MQIQNTIDPREIGKWAGRTIDIGGKIAGQMAGAATCRMQMGLHAVGAVGAAAVNALTSLGNNFTQATIHVNDICQEQLREVCRKLGGDLTETERAPLLEMQRRLLDQIAENHHELKKFLQLVGGGVVIVALGACGTVLLIARPAQGMRFLASVVKRR
jgi:hypothetical protein